MSKLLQLTNATAQTVSNNGFINLGTISRRVGCNSTSPSLSYNGSNLINIITPGYYKIDISMDLISTAATQQRIISIIQDGVSVSDISSYATILGEISTKSRSFIVRVFCNDSLSIGLQNTTGAALSISNLNISIIKVA